MKLIQLGELLFDTKRGFKVILERGNYIDRVVFREGFYESEVLDCLLESNADPFCLWDIGANIGLHSIGCKVAKPDAEVISFEPDYKNFSKLHRACIANDLNLRLMNFALADHIGCEMLYRDDSNHGRSTLYPHGKGGYGNLRNYVLSTSGDFLVDNEMVPPPTVIKLDVEGYETKVIQGLRNTLTNYAVERIVFEAPANFPREESELRKLLSILGYRFDVLIRRESTHHNLENFVAYK